jgi:hypothetical protein
MKKRTITLEVQISEEQFRDWIPALAQAVAKEIAALIPSSSSAADEILTRKLAAKRLKLSLPSIDKLTHCGQLIGHRIPKINAVRYYESNVLKLLEEMQTIQNKREQQ